MVYKPLAGQRDLPGWVMTTLKRLGRYVWAGDVSNDPADYNRTPEERAKHFFEAADTSGDGVLPPAPMCGRAIQGRVGWG